MTPRTRGPILDRVRILALSACLAGCLSKPTFECADNAACGAQGICQPDKLCSFPDSSCASGQRYGELSGPQANQCVGGDMPPDAPPEACLGGGAYILCVTPPADAVMLSGTLVTDSDPRCTAPPAQWLASQPDACVIAGAITVGNLAVTGGKPLVLAGTTVAIDGVLDLASHRGGATGPAAPASACGAFPTAPGNNPQGAGGGAGGTFATIGGNGGRGDGVIVDGGVAAPVAASPTSLRAGCAGQTGGTGQSAAGTRGQGGGAIFIAAQAITFGTNGTINASGAGGAGGGALSGGSGGGSGGMIVLHAPSITGGGGARLVANGGGGAAGASGFGSAPNGADPNPANPTTPAPGGSGGSGGVGGAGFAGTMQAAAGQANQNRGGGGGGGGAGYIQSNVPLANITSSPAATVVP